MNNNINHIGFIMDGNGRWAKRINKPRIYGHKIGAEKIKEVLIWCKEYNIKSVSMFAFSLENWKRSKFEVNFLMNLLFKKILNKETLNFFKKEGIKFIWNSFKKKLNNKIIDGLEFLQKETKECKNLNFELLFNYGSQQNIIHNLNKMMKSHLQINLENFNKINDPYNLGPLDLVIRTSNEKRLSNFMLFECAYAEFVFSKLYWPEYTKIEFKKNIDEFNNRNRKFGEVKE